MNMFCELTSRKFSYGELVGRIVHEIDLHEANENIIGVASQVKLEQIVGTGRRAEIP